MAKVNLYGPDTEGHCGYCNGNGSASYGMRCNSMTVWDYEALMVKGWRRCGSYYYKPNLPESCCKLFTIRLEAAAYKMNQSQKKKLNKFNRFLNPQTMKKSENKKAKRQDGKQKLDMTIPEDLLSLLRDVVSQV